MTHIEMFSNGEFELQVTPIGDSFRVSGPSLARALSFSDASSMVRNLPAEEKGSVLEQTPGGEQAVSYVTEAGFYQIIGQRQPSRIKDPSTRAKVERFQRWVYHEVLPSLRRTGSYTIPTQAVEVEEFYQPHTLTWDETRALIRQRYGIPMSVNELTRTLRTAGVLKQNGTPRKDWEHLFWFTGSSWNVHPHMVAQLTKKIVDTGRELQQFRFLQAQLELEGVGSPALLQSERPIPRQRNVSPRPAAREDVQDRPDDNRP
jgi:prophage antirepressor-like protein